MNIKGEIKPPGDKSISHRAFMFGALAKGTTTITGCLESHDVISTRNAMAALGAGIEKTGDAWKVNGGNLTEPKTVIDAGNSGTTARLISGILAGLAGVSTITGDKSLVNRPMARVIEPLSRMGTIFLARGGKYLPMAVKGGSLKGISYDMNIASAQVKSSLLLAGLRADGTTTITEPAKSRDHTEKMLSGMGAKLDIKGNTVSITGRQELFASNIDVPGDPSSAAFPAIWAAATPGSEILIRDICLNPTRIGFIPVLKRMGADISIENIHKTAGEDVGDILIKGSELTSTTIGGEEIPSLIDEIPILTAAACLAHGRTIIRDAKELRVKETDRIAAMVNGISCLGARVEETEDGMVIQGPLRLSSGRIKTFSDHRIAMSFYILSKACDIDIDLDDRACVDISFPGFFELMGSFC